MSRLFNRLDRLPLTEVSWKWGGIPYTTFSEKRAEFAAKHLFLRILGIFC